MLFWSLCLLNLMAQSCAEDSTHAMSLVFTGAVIEALRLRL